MLKNSSDKPQQPIVVFSKMLTSERLASSPHLEFPILSIVPTLWLTPTPRPDTRPFLHQDQILTPSYSSGHFLSSNVQHGHETPCYFIQNLPPLKCYFWCQRHQQQLVLVAMPRSQRPRIWWQKYLAKLIADNPSVCWGPAIDGGRAEKLDLWFRRLKSCHRWQIVIDA